MYTVGLLAYGEMGESAILSLQKKFKVQWVVLPLKKVQTEAEIRVEKYAKEKKIKILYQPQLKILEQFIKDNKPDCVVVCSYNLILPASILKITKFINVHLGDLPRYRGRATVNWAIINGRNEIGVSIHKVEPQLDSGNLIEQKIITITDNDTVRTVYDKINSYVRSALPSGVLKAIQGFKGIPQKGKPTYCCTRLAEDGLVDWNKPTKEIYNFIRALTEPYPGAFSYLNDKKIIIWDSEIPAKPRKFEGRIPGRVVAVIKNYGVEVLTADSSLIIKNITINGQKMNASDVITSLKISLGINMALLYEKLLQKN